MRSSSNSHSKAPSRTQELALSQSAHKPDSASLPVLSRSASLKRLTTKAEKLGQHLHFYGKAPSESQIKDLVHAAEEYATKLADKDPRGVVGSHWRDYKDASQDWSSALKAAAAAADKASALHAKQKQELHDTHLRNIGEYAPPALLHALMTKAPTAKPAASSSAPPTTLAPAPPAAKEPSAAAPLRPVAAARPASTALSPSPGTADAGPLPPEAPLRYPGVSFFAHLRELRSLSPRAAPSSSGPPPTRTSALFGRDDDDGAAAAAPPPPAFDPVAREWHALMRHPPPVTPATRPDVRDAREYPYPGRRWAARKREMQRFGSAIATYESDPELNPVLVMQVVICAGRERDRERERERRERERERERKRRSDGVTERASDAELNSSWRCR